jgi:hypothetical protein
MVPLLVRGLRHDNTTAIKRKASVIIENMAKLVDNPLDAGACLCIFICVCVKRILNVDTGGQAACACADGAAQWCGMHDAVLRDDETLAILHGCLQQPQPLHTKVS